MGENCSGHIGNNTKGAYFTIQKALPFLNDGASIIFNTSAADEAGVINGTVCAATRAALRSFTRSSAAELVAVEFASMRSVPGRSTRQKDSSVQDCSKQRWTN
jgi:NAD(P)-dependent dehydrogenase (short-subunit alcohol dehydrogenase family)